MLIRESFEKPAPMLGIKGAALLDNLKKAITKGAKSKSPREMA